MTSADARRDPAPAPSVRTQRELIATAVERLESALYRIQTGGSDEAAYVDALCSIAASLLRIGGAPARERDGHRDNVDRALVALTNSVRELFARTDSLDERFPAP